MLFQQLSYLCTNGTRFATRVWRGAALAFRRKATSVALASEIIIRKNDAHVQVWIGERQRNRFDEHRMRKAAKKKLEPRYTCRQETNAFCKTFGKKLVESNVIEEKKSLLSRGFV